MKKSTFFLQLGFAILILDAQNAFAQPPAIHFQHLSVEQGLSASLVFSITQDKYSFIWLGTTDGLNRFDGKNVETFHYKPGDKNSLPDNAVRCLLTDSCGLVWVGTPNGLACYDPHANSFRLFINDPKNINSLPGNIVNAIEEDNHGFLWIGTGQGLCSFDIKKNHFQRFPKKSNSHNSISSDQIRDIKFAPDGTMWIATGNGLNRLDLSTMKFDSFFNDPADSSTISNNSLTKIAIGKDGNLWTGFISGNKLHLDCFNTRTYRCKRVIKFIGKRSTSSDNFLSTLFSAGDSRISVFIDKSGRLWLGTIFLGLYLFFPDKDLLYEYKMNPFDAGGLQSNAIASIYQDHSGMIWLATASGAERFNPDESKFILYRLESVKPFSPGQKSVQAIAEDTLHRLWIGTSDGLYILDRTADKFSHYHWKDNDTQQANTNFITAICCDRKGNMWVGTLHGLKLFDAGKNSFRSFYAEKNNASLADNSVSSIVCDKNGDLLIASRRGLSIYFNQTRRFVNFNNDTLHAELNKRNNVVFEDNRGTIWIGTQNSGLVRYDRLGGKPKRFTPITGDTSSFASVYVCSIAQDHDGVIWAGTRNGLCRYNEKAESFTTFSEKNGLPDSRIKQLLVDDKNRIWMSSNKGISVLNETRTRFANYDPSDGLQGWEFSEPSAFKTNDGYFCYGGSNGFNMFHPDSLKKNLFIPPIVLRRVTIFNQPLKTDSSYSNLKSLHFSYKQNFFSFEFAALNYDHPEKNQYACQLIPFDKNIVQLGTNHTVSYTNVPPAKYTLKVIASNNDGVWNDKGYELHLTITPPFWATWWFRAIVIISFISAVFLYFKFRENRIKKEQARQTAINKQIAELRMTALQTQMNPHFIFNCLNSIQHLIAIREKEEAISYLAKFSKLIRRILENSVKNTVSINNELELLDSYIQLERLRFNNKFEYHVAVDEKIDKENTEIPPLLIQPYLENAILHGLVNKNGQGDLWLLLDKNDGLLICKIEDNGIGRARAQEIRQRKESKHKSLGMKVTNERISTLSALVDYQVKVVVEDLYENNSVSNEATKPTGTRVIISIPIKEEEA